MSDGEEAIHTTVCMAFPDITKLYCYFHFMKLVKTEFKNNPEYQNLIKFVKNCHFARDSNEYDIIWDKYMVENDKRSNPPIVVPNHPVEDVPIPVEDVPNHQVEDVPIPVEDVPKQKICDWLNYICYIPKFMNWQAYHTPCGYATTNNPLESFNKNYYQFQHYWIDYSDTSNGNYQKQTRLRQTPLYLLQEQ
ncbi:hypothetical protein BC833DRAFT_613329 [Globomyces pollinis-pini]|nr:hypothetical protein BC833DRAFT_613329 [Globomyces pollinis-pini]